MDRLTLYLMIVMYLCGVLKAQYLNPPITYTLVPTPPIPDIPVPCDNKNSCRLAIEELGALIQLLKELSGDEKSSARISEDVIVKLVNALVFVATSTCKDTGYYPNEHDPHKGSFNGVGVGLGAAVGVGVGAGAGAGGVGGAGGAGVGVGAAVAAGVGAITGATGA